MKTKLNETKRNFFFQTKRYDQTQPISGPRKSENRFRLCLTICAPSILHLIVPHFFIRRNFFSLVLRSSVGYVDSLCISVSKMSSSSSKSRSRSSHSEHNRIVLFIRFHSILHRIMGEQRMNGKYI